MTHFGGMQLKPKYKQALDPKFLGWYFKTYTGTRMIYLHWPAECRDQDDDHYHQVVGLGPDGKPKTWHNTPLTEDLDDHTYGRNTGSCAIALGGFAGAATTNLGSNAATPEMINLLIITVADACEELKVPVANVMSHAEAADDVDQAPTPELRELAHGKAYPAPWAEDPDPYGPLSTYERWDLHCWIGPQTHKLYPPKGVALPGTCEYLMDYIRGNVILMIQENTREHWDQG